MSAKQFLIWWAVASLVFVAVAVLFDVIIDPYLVFGTPRIAGLNLWKPAAVEQEAMAKVYGLARADPRTIILGSSRPDIALNPESPAWPREMRPVYNLAFAGAGIFAVERSLEQVLSTKSPRYVLIGLDFEDFLVDPKSAAPASPPLSDFERRLSITRNGRPNPDLTRQRIKDYVTASLSLSALGDSLWTVLANRQGTSPDVTSSGRVTEAGFQQVVSADGEYNLFAQKDKIFFREYSVGHRVIPDAWQPNPALHELRAMLDMCAARGISVILFIQPEHVDRLEGWDLLDYWNAIEAWKRELASIVARYQQNQDAVRLWDFSGYNPYTEETIPQPGDRTSRLTWFWESVHYTEKLGELMLTRMLRTEPSPFGILLTEQTLENDLVSMRSARARFQQNRPQDIKRLEDLYRETAQADGPRRTAAR
jgi:hypothetical protein